MLNKRSAGLCRFGSGVGTSTLLGSVSHRECRNFATSPVHTKRHKTERMRPCICTRLPGQRGLIISFFMPQAVFVHLAGTSEPMQSLPHSQPWSPAIKAGQVHVWMHVERVLMRHATPASCTSLPVITCTKSHVSCVDLCQVAMSPCVCAVFSVALWFQ